MGSGSLFLIAAAAASSLLLCLFACFGVRAWLAESLLVGVASEAPSLPEVSTVMTSGGALAFFDADADTPDSTSLIVMMQ